MARDVHPVGRRRQALPARAESALRPHRPRAPAGARHRTTVARRPPASPRRNPAAARPDLRAARTALRPEPRRHRGPDHRRYRRQRDNHHAHPRLRPDRAPRPPDRAHARAPRHPPRPRHHRAARRRAPAVPRWPARSSLDAGRISDRLKTIGLHPRADRAAALFTLAAALLARMLGISIRTAVSWQKAASGDWMAYAAVSRRPPRSSGAQHYPDGQQRRTKGTGQEA